MNIKFDRTDLLLEAGQVIRIHDAVGTRVRCLHGALWITQHRDLEDHFIRAGGTLTLDHPGLVLIHAIEPTELALSEAAPGPSVAGRIARTSMAMLRAIGRWIALRFGPQAITARRLRGWYGAL
ncbi:MAG TPA: DUF2917 domain-containing protein [Burkholderiales bacterium]